jgi:hypothetical protein
MMKRETFAIANIYVPVSNCDLVAARSLIALAASRLALRAPALRGRHAVPTAMTVGPNHVITNHRIERGDHLAHHRHDRDLRQLTGGLETIVERLKHGIPVAGAHRCHVEHLAHVRTTAPDAAPALERAALEGIGRDADQRSDLFAAHGPEFGQKRRSKQAEFVRELPTTESGKVQKYKLRERGVTETTWDHDAFPDRAHAARGGNAAATAFTC